VKISKQVIFEWADSSIFLLVSHSRMITSTITYFQSISQLHTYVE